MSQGNSVASSSKPAKPRSRAVKRDPQPQLSDLMKYGVKVRDFGYESVLPPVRTVYRQRRQVQPSVPRQLRREDTEPLDDFSSQSQPWSQQSNLGRESTEPAIDSDIVASQPRRELGYCNIKAFDEEIEALVNSQNRMSPTPLSSSQNVGNYITTPTVTPNGSLKWESSAPVAPQSIPRFPSRQPSRLQHEISFTFPSSPLTPCPPTPRQGSLMLTSLKRSPSMASLTQPPAKRRTVHKDTSMQISLSPTPRYFLRTRNKSSTTSTAKPSKRLCTSHSSSAPAPRRSVSIQSSQARKKLKTEHNSPSTRQRVGTATTLGNVVAHDEHVYCI